MRSFTCLLRVSYGPKSKGYRNLTIFFSEISFNGKLVNEVLHSLKVYHTINFQNLVLNDKVYMAL